MTNDHPRILLLLILLISIGCNDQGDSRRTVSNHQAPLPADIVKLSTTFTNLKKQTPESVYVNPEFITFCRGISKDEVENAKLKSGPHANCTVEIFMNEKAAKAFAVKSIYPVGAVVVKQKNMLGYRDSSTQQWEGDGHGVGGMIKRREGFDDEHGNWEYFYFEDIEKIEFGKIESCVNCHSKARRTDYVFGDWAKPGDAFGSAVSDY